MSMTAMLLTTASKDGGLAEREESLLVQRIGGPVLDVATVLASPIQHRLAEIGCEDLPPKLGHTACELAVSARDLENPLPRLEPKQPFNRWLDKVSLPGRARPPCARPRRWPARPTRSGRRRAGSRSSFTRERSVPRAWCWRRTRDWSWFRRRGDRS